MLLQSDLINWYICQDGSGSILNWKDGSISCRVAKTLVASCNNTAPSHFHQSLDYGMRIDGNRNYNFFYKVAVMSWSSGGGRILDACGNHKRVIKKGVNDPRGAWFVR